MVARNLASKARLAPAPAASGKKRNPPPPALPEFDRLIHERLRLGMISALAVTDTLSFNDLKRLLKTSDGNLSVHARKLEDAEYVTCEKRFHQRVPRTDYRLTAKGRAAFERYLDEMELMIRTARP